MINNISNILFNFDILSILMMVLVVFIGLCIGSFAMRYMKGDIKYTSFFVQLSVIVLSVILMVCADNLILFFITWCLSNVLLVRLMIHKSSWKAAKASGILAGKNYLLGALFLFCSFSILYFTTGLISIKALLHQDIDSVLMKIALILLLLGAMTQSAIYPFHRWLISSLNSPTPVSAIMHAGLVNGGGFLLIRFAPLYLRDSNLLTLVFIIGITTAFIGTLWKLMQSDVKRMLACSTMAQMGFMIAQCGLGLFPAALAHLIFHGLFKSYLFLASSSAAQEKRFDLGYPPKPHTFVCSIMCGLVGSFGFAYASNKSWFSGDTTFVLVLVAFISSAQFALPMVRNKGLKNISFALISTAIVGLAYGGSVRLITFTIEPIHFIQPQPLNGFHFFGMVVMTLTWFSILFLRGSKETVNFSSYMEKGYVLALNASQPDAVTITAHRNHYKYL